VKPGRIALRVSYEGDRVNRINDKSSPSEIGCRRHVTLEWLSLKQLTAYAPVCERTLRAWIHAAVDPLPAVRVGKKILVRRSAFDDWLERRRLRPTSGLDVGVMVDQIVAGVSGRK